MNGKEGAMPEETAPAVAAPETPPTGTEAPPTGEAAPATPEDVEDLRKALAKANSEARDFRLEKNSLAKELDKIRTASMSETEKAVAEAETRGRSAATAEFGERLARTQFDAIAGRRNPAFNTDEVMDFLDLKRLVTETGEPDTAKITAAAEKLVPVGEIAPPGFDGGVRTTPPAPQGMSDMIRKAAGRAG